MSNEKKEVVFATGLNVRKVNDFKFGISINVEKFTDFMSAYKNEKGYVNIDICKAFEKESWYGKLNVWQPTKKEETKKAQEVFEGEVIDDEEIPF